MAYWLLKSEPSSFSWDDQVHKGAKGEKTMKTEGFQILHRVIWHNLRGSRLGVDDCGGIGIKQCITVLLALYH